MIIETPVTFYTKSTNSVAISSVPDEPEIWFTMKSNAMLPDDQSTIQISKTSGLIYTNGFSACSVGLDSSYGNVVVSGSVVVVTISASAAPTLYGSLPVDFIGEIKTKTSASIITVVTQFPIKVKPTLTRSI